MRRREFRDHVFRLVFQFEFHSLEDIPNIIKQYWFCLGTDTQATEEERKLINARAVLVAQRLPEIDADLADKMENWKLSRLNKCDLAILRLAVYEIRYDPEMPDKIAINEAVELAKLYGEDQSQRFVNGVLSKFMKN